MIIAAGAGTACAADCAPAATLVDRAICADPQARKAEEELDRAYAALAGRLGETQRAALQGDQAVWLERRQRCTNYREDTEIVDDVCVVRETGERIRLLRGEPEFSGPDAPRFLPVFYYRKAPEVLISMAWPNADGPGMAPFNELLNKSTAEMKVLPGVVDGPYSLDEVPALEMVERYRIQHASARLISVIFSGYEDTGGAHAFGSYYSVNYLPVEGRPLCLDDVVDPEALARLVPICRADILAERERRGDGPWEAEPAVRDGFISGAIIEIGGWSFDRDGAVIRYNYDSYGRDGYDCRIPWAELKAVAKMNAPLPFE
ncbi:lysozyme inhibitor LprI family protein [Oleomonas cavernae]|uniref:lysozyme inhibitor LprI family protein n=1 Tax=Oleomonas cavernae TaxID=2320859 RepID=UPI0013143E08|nr:lysozyme inhibitor LprI family protein [Oleomonas cavernae]